MSLSSAHWDVFHICKQLSINNFKYITRMLEYIKLDNKEQNVLYQITNVFVTKALSTIL